MITYSDSTYFKDYCMYERKAICDSCNTQIGRQNCINREGIFHFEIRAMDKYKYCPYCGKPLFEEEK